MMFPKKEIMLNDGRRTFFRSPTPEDSAALLAFLKDTAGETDYLLRYPEESLTDV